MVGNAENRTGEGAALGCSYSSAAKNFAAHAASPYRPLPFLSEIPLSGTFFVGGECRGPSRCGVSRSCDAIGDLLSYSALLFLASIAIPSLTLLTCSARSAELCAAGASPYRPLPFLSEIPLSGAFCFGGECRESNRRGRSPRLFVFERSEEFCRAWREYLHIYREHGMACFVNCKGRV